jgi:hypothetical protein
VVESKCFLCGNIVLGIKGQDAVLQPYYLQEEGRSVVAADLYGPCHLSCLVTSQWGGFWAERRIKHIEGVLGLPRVFDHGELVAFGNARHQEAIIVRSDGVEFQVSFGSAATALQISGGYLVPVRDEWYLHLPAHASLVKTIQEALLKEGSYALHHLMIALGLADRLLFPEALERAELQIRNPNSKKTRRLIQSWSDTFVSARAFYSSFIPDAVMGVVRQVKTLCGDSGAWKLH